MLKSTLPAPEILKDILGQKITILYSSETGFSLSAPGIDSFENDAFNFVDEFEKYLKVEKNGCKKLNFQKNRKKLKVQYKTEILNSTDINQKQYKNSCCFTISGKLSVCKENGQLYIEIEDLKYAEKYEIDLIWEVGNSRYDKTYEYDQKTPFPEISLITIPVLGKLYLAVRAIHQNKELSSDWSEGNYLTDVTAAQLIQWAWNADLCLRDCFLMLKQHGVDLSKDTTMLSVTKVYGQPDSKYTIAKRHCNAGDDIEQCYAHLNRAYPNLSTLELIQCLWKAGYHDDQIRLTIYKHRHMIREKEINEIFLFLFHEEKGTFMTMNEKLSFLINMRQTKGLSSEQWQAEIAEIYANYDPIELAKTLKDVLNFDAKEIADSLKNIDVQYKAITVGGILLHDEIYPDTSRENMTATLEETFSDENIEKAIQILYPTTIRVLASIPWNDTGITIEQDEYVEIEYLSGRWSVNPQWGTCNADGNRSYIAKPGYLLPGGSEGCLVAKIESSSNTIRKIGLKFSLPKVEGRLYLGANDDINALYGVGYKDNAGEIQVVVKKKLR